MVDANSNNFKKGVVALRVGSLAGQAMRRILFFAVVVLAVRDTRVRLSLRAAAGRTAKAAFRAAQGR